MQSQDTFPIQEADLYAHLRAANDYGRDVAALVAVVPRGASRPHADLRARLDTLTGAVDVYRESIASFTRADSEIANLAAQARQPKPGASLQPAPLPSLTVAGTDISRLMDSGHQTKLRQLRQDIMRIQLQSSRLAATLTRLPEWTRSTAPERTVLTVRPYGDRQLNVAIVRRDQGRVFSLVPVDGGGAPASSGGTATTGGAGTTGATGTGGGTGTAGGAGTIGGTGTGGGTGTSATAAPTAAGPGIQLTPIQTFSPPGIDTVAVVRIPVLKRYRFQLGAGLMYSPLDHDEFETMRDTTALGPGVHVRHKGVEEQRVAPMAVLSYTIYPFSGRVVDARAYDTRRTLDDYLRQMGLSAQIGVSIQNPTEEFFFGLGTEPIPGVSVGSGMHLRYSDFSRHAVRS